MKAAVILPQQFLHLTKEDDYHMALAHLVGKPGFEDYTEFYKNIGHAADKFLMLDTGLIEGDARPTSELIEKARMLKADEMILNDVFMDGDATLDSTWKALVEVDKSGLDIRTMGVPQGNSLEEWVTCAKEMVRWNIDTIGVPKVITSFAGPFGRLHAILLLQQYLPADKEIHLLGCWESPIELKAIEAARHDMNLVPVRGVDSAIAYAYAREGLRITDDERPEGEINFAAKVCDMDVLAYNIAVYKAESAGRSSTPRIL